MAEFMSWVIFDNAKYWKDPQHPEYANRWHVQSIVVRSEWQRKGIGKRLMDEVIERAKAENKARSVNKEGQKAAQIFIGLESSPDGEWMYRKLGFRLLGLFCKSPESEGGGVMIWEPPNGTKSEGDYNAYLEELSKKGK
jgi:GNAT superfamily N-acetyltransferase